MELCNNVTSTPPCSSMTDVCIGGLCRDTCNSTGTLSINNYLLLTGPTIELSIDACKSAKQIHSYDSKFVVGELISSGFPFLADILMTKRDQKMQ